MKYTTDIKYAEFDKNGLSTKSGWAVIYRYSHDTQEFIGADFDNVPLGGSVVGNSCLDKPELPTEDGIAIVRSADEKSWIHAADHRGKTAYRTENRQPAIIDFIGDLSTELTLQEPKSEFDVWNGKEWVVDAKAQKAALVAEADNEKAQRLNEANNTITYLQEAVDVRLATESEAAALQEWKKYRVLLNRVDASTAPDIEWPEKP